MKIKGIAKTTTIVILCLMFGVGVLGSFLDAFDMDNYLLFIQAFSGVFITLILSIGASKITDKIKGVK